MRLSTSLVHNLLQRIGNTANPEFGSNNVASEKGTEKGIEKGIETSTTQGNDGRTYRLAHRISYLLSAWIALAVVADLALHIAWPGLGQIFAYTCLVLVLIARYPMWSHRWFMRATPISVHAAWLSLGMLVVLIAGFTFPERLLSLWAIVAVEGHLVLSFHHRRWGRLWFVTTALVAALVHFVNMANVSAFVDVLQVAPLMFAALVGLDLLMEALFPAADKKKTSTAPAQTNPITAQRYRNYVNRVEALAVDRERARIAREFHDTLGHTLTTLDVQMELMARLPESRVAEIQEAARQSRKLVKDGLADVRRSIQALHPNALDDFSIVEAIQSLVDEFKRASNITIVWRTEGKVAPITPELALPIYRATQEALTNVRRHSGATEVLLTLAFTSEKIWLVIEDDGRAQTPQKFGFGLSGIRDRVQELGGHFAAGPRPEGGFRLVVKLHK